MVKNKLGMTVLIEISLCGKTVAMATAQRSHLVPFMMNIDGAKFEEHRFNTTRDMLD